jgi:dihydropteroate synthase
MKPAELGPFVPSDLPAQQLRRSKLAKALRFDHAPRLMGIVNVTEDSFYSESRALDDEAVARALAMWDAGATWVDIGGESTRPGAQSVASEVELARVVPVIRTLRNRRPQALISVDTRHADVAQAALEAGADMVNDVSGLRDPAMVDVVVNAGCAVCVMHMLGEPGTMQANPSYRDCCGEVSEALLAKRDELLERGHPEDLIMLDPGIGFGKTQAHNLELLRAGRSIAQNQDTPLLWGVSRKSIVGHLTGRDNPNDRLPGTLALACVAHRANIDVLRVHDVEAHVDVLATLAAFTSSPSRQEE